MSPAERDKEGASDQVSENANKSASNERTPFERFVAATKRVLSVSKAELDKRESDYRKQRSKRRGSKG